MNEVMFLTWNIKREENRECFPLDRILRFKGQIQWLRNSGNVHVCFCLQAHEWISFILEGWVVYVLWVSRLCLTRLYNLIVLKNNQFLELHREKTAKFMCILKTQRGTVSNVYENKRKFYGFLTGTSIFCLKSLDPIRRILLTRRKQWIWLVYVYKNKTKP